MSHIEAAMQLAADAALKRKSFEGEKAELQLKTFKAESGEAVIPPPMSAAPEIRISMMSKPDVTTAPPNEQAKPEGTRPTFNRAREVRLDQNRKAARESRRRKKVMIEELQRSVIFFSRANSTLKQQNDDLTRMLMQAQSQVAAAEGAGQSSASSEPDSKQPAAVEPQGVNSEGGGMEPAAVSAAEQAQAQAVATQAMYETQGYSAAAARSAAQTMNASPAPGPMSAMTAVPQPTVSAGSGHVSIPSMTPGATMQAMANFQQAAAAAMQAAMHGMQGIPGVNLNQLSATPAGANAQQAYTDTMTALAMQQAAAAAGHQFLSSMQQHQQQHPAHLFPMMSWPTHVAMHQPAQVAPQQLQPAMPPSAPLHYPAPENQ
jgi:hypothetical protein